jgi:formylglycine-generating enzyme required for sulfatase activity
LNDLVEVEAQTVTLCKPRDQPSFGWDNEYGTRSFALSAFRASRFKVTNGEFLEFVKDGGYGRPELWTAAGWQWR